MKKLNLLFIVSKTRIRKDGKVPLLCRLTYLDKRKQFATGLFINPKNWNNSLQECEPPSNENNYKKYINQKSPASNAKLFIGLTTKPFWYFRT